MFKPNIRGVGKRNLSFELTGWRNRLDYSLIKHRYPWRRSWIELTKADSLLTPVLARSGQVYLLQTASAVTTKSASIKRVSGRRPIFLFGLVCAVGLAVGTALLPIGTVQKVHTALPSEALYVHECKSILRNPEPEITKWLAGIDLDQVKVQEIQREEFGGMQLRRIHTSCDDLQANFQITLTLVDKAWQLKNFARLEN